MPHKSDNDAGYGNHESGCATAAYRDSGRARRWTQIRQATIVLDIGTVRRHAWRPYRRQGNAAGHNEEYEFDEEKISYRRTIG